MSLEIVDELMTPGCPQCAVKHLSAALCYAAELGFLPRRQDAMDSQVLAARAYVNLGEALIGYKSHLWYAVGLLQRAEERFYVDMPSTYKSPLCKAVRGARLDIEERGFAAVTSAMGVLFYDAHFGSAAMYCAHIDEAKRELPGYGWPDEPKDIPALIESIRKEYFDLPEAAVAEGETTTK